MTSKLSPSAPRLAAGLLLGGVAGAAALLAAAMASYPGGTWMDPRAQGHDFWRNFVCDLTQPAALNGAPNPAGARLAQAGMMALVGALLPFWLLLPRLLRGPGWIGQAVRAAGVVSVAGLVAVPLLPSLRFGLLHAAAVLTASVPGLVAAGLAVIGLRERPGLRAIGAITVLTALVDAALYTRGIVRPGPTPVALPALQKVAALGLFGWMVGVAAAVLGTGGAGRAAATPATGPSS